MPAFDLNKFMDFWEHFADPPSPQKREAVRRLWAAIPEDLRAKIMTDEAYWVQAYRKKPEKPKTLPPQSTSEEGIKFICQFEGFSAKAYYDPVGILTIGYGHTGADVKPGMEITKDKAMELMENDLQWAEDAVCKTVRQPISQAQFDALVSFTYNCGAEALATSTLARKLNAGDILGAANEFLKWTKAGGLELPGLVRRREEEKRMFLNGISQSKPSSAKVSIQSKVKILAQQTPKSCGLTCVAMAINLISGKKVDDLWVQNRYGYGLLQALNENCGGVKWVDAGNFTPSMWPAIRENLIEGMPTIIFLNGPEFSPSGYGHILMIVSMDSDNIGLADPNGGVFRTVSKNLIETCPAHTDGKAVLMVN